MHYHMEIIMPPTDDVDASIAQIMEKFNENGKDKDGYPNAHAFWDSYTIGGRYSGSKIEAKIGHENIERFSKELIDRGVTVSSIQFGKQELHPASQSEMVDELWREWFPDSGIDKCPLFKHAGSSISGDICKLSDIPEGLTAYRVIFAGPKWDDDGLQAENMLQTEVWNGVTYCECKWSGSVKDALSIHLARISHYREEYRSKRIPTDDWLVVTVDYHS